jgi:hypothetical protein
MRRGIVAGVGSETVPLEWGNVAGKGIGRERPVGARFVLGRIVGGGVCSESSTTDDSDHITTLEDGPTSFASILTTVVLLVGATTCRMAYGKRRLDVYTCGHVPASRAYVGGL